MQGFIKGLALPDEDKQRLLAMTPSTYTGLAESLARRFA
jgi:adenylosuccinate lyase